MAADAWSLEPAGVDDAAGKLGTYRHAAQGLRGDATAFGIKTGLNEAFLIDTPTRHALVAADPASSDLIRPYIRGQDVDRWQPDGPGSG